MSNTTQINVLPPPETKVIYVTEGRAGPPGPAGASSSVLQYKADANSSNPSDPGAGKMRWSDPVQNLSTALFFDRLTDGGFDATGILLNTEIYDEFIIQDLDLALNHQVWRKTGPSEIIAGDWFAVPVEFVSQSGLSEFSHNQRLAVLIKSVGSVGPQGPPGEPGPSAPTGSGSLAYFNMLPDNLPNTTLDPTVLWEFPVEMEKTYAGRITLKAISSRAANGAKFMLNLESDTVPYWIDMSGFLIQPTGGSIIGPNVMEPQALIFTTYPPDVYNTMYINFVTHVNIGGTLQFLAGFNELAGPGWFTVQIGSWIEVRDYTPIP